jgi:hypothetical protein
MRRLISLSVFDVSWIVRTAIVTYQWRAWCGSASNPMARQAGTQYVSRKLFAFNGVPRAEE